MDINLYKNDLPDNVRLEGAIAIDTEATGLSFSRDRLCLVQIADETGKVHMVHFDNHNYSAPHLKKILQDEKRIKIFHYARFDVAIICKWLDVMVKNIYCTKIASKIARTYSETHGLKDLCRELLNVHISKQQQSSYWGNSQLSKEQLEYAANDVIYLHKLKEKLEEMLKREKRFELAHRSFAAVELMVNLDLGGWNGHEVFSH